MTRRAYVALALLLCAAPAFAQVKKTVPDRSTQEETKPATKVETFLARRSLLLVKEFSDLGEVPSAEYGTIKLQTLTIYEPGRESDKVQGIRIGVTEAGAYSSERVAFLDADEVQEAIASLDSMMRLADAWKSQGHPYAEVLFITRGGCQIGFYQKGQSQKAFAKAGSIGEAVVFFPVASLAAIRAMLADGQQRISLYYRPDR